MKPYSDLRYHAKRRKENSCVTLFPATTRFGGFLRTMVTTTIRPAPPQTEVFSAKSGSCPVTPI